MDDELGDLPVGDVLVRGGMIDSVGVSLETAGVEEFDGSGTIVLPGLVDTHNHLFITQMRGLFARPKESAYFALSK